MKVKMMVLAATAALVAGAPAHAAVIFNYLSVSTDDTTAAASGNAASSSAYTTGTADAFKEAFSVGETPLTAATHVSTDATTVTPTFITHPDTFAASDTKHLHPIHHAPTAGTPITTLNANATASEAATAGLVDAADGSFSFAGSTSATVYTANAGAKAYNGGQEIIYDFSNVGTSVLTLSYDLAESFDYANSHNILKLTDLTQPGLSISPVALGNNVTGTLSYTLLGGHDYEFSVSSSYSDDLASRTTLGTTLGSHNEVYDWSVIGVPEPATWALMLTGCGMAGVAIRRRRDAVISVA